MMKEVMELLISLFMYRKISLIRLDSCCELTYSVVVIAPVTGNSFSHDRQVRAFFCPF